MDRYFKPFDLATTIRWKYIKRYPHLGHLSMKHPSWELNFARAALKLKTPDDVTGEEVKVLVAVLANWKGPRNYIKDVF